MQAIHRIHFYTTALKSISATLKLIVSKKYRFNFFCPKLKSLAVSILCRYLLGHPVSPETFKIVLHHGKNEPKLVPQLFYEMNPKVGVLDFLTTKLGCRWHKINASREAVCV